MLYPRYFWHEKSRGETSAISLVLETGLEPVRPLRPLDFKSNVSTNSTTRAAKPTLQLAWTKKNAVLQRFLERKKGFEPSTPTLAR